MVFRDEQKRTADREKNQQFWRYLNLLITRKAVSGRTPKRKAVGSNPARDAKKRRETLDFSKCPRRYFFAHRLKIDYV